MDEVPAIPQQFGHMIVNIDIHSLADEQQTERSCPNQTLRNRRTWGVSRFHYGSVHGSRSMMLLVILSFQGSRPKTTQKWSTATHNTPKKHAAKREEGRARRCEIVRQLVVSKLPE